MQISMNQQQRWLAQQVAEAEGFDGDLAAFVSDVVRRFLTETSTSSS